MIELLGVHVVQVAVALEDVDAGDDIEVLHLGECLELGDGLSERILVEVARRDDVGFRVLSQDRRNEVLREKGGALVETSRQWQLTI